MDIKIYYIDVNGEKNLVYLANTIPIFISDIFYARKNWKKK